MSYVKPVARLIAEMLREHVANNTPTRTVDRADLRKRWRTRFPKQDRRQQLLTEQRKVIRRRTSYLAGADHHRGGRSNGNLGTAHLAEALRQLEKRGVVQREESTVRVLDIPELLKIAHPAPRQEDADRTG